jgi:hypothetical protein
MFTPVNQVLGAHTYNPATQKAEIRRIKVQSQTWTNSSQDPTSKIPNTKQGWRNGSSSEVAV